MSDGDQPAGDDLNGIGGWMIPAMILLGITILFLPFLIWESAAETSIVLAAIFLAAELYSILCLVWLLQKKKIAGYMMIAYFGVGLLATIALEVYGAYHGETAPHHTTAAIRGGLELAYLLYFALSKRVERTLTN